MVELKKPNFFIIGAPKCGTTSLAAWLSDHPQVFFSQCKEPHHFNTDENWVWTPSHDEYESLFKDSSERHLAIGEGSVWYLHSQHAVPNIEQYAPHAKYLVCMRNPVEMAYSLHEQQVVSGNEHILDFTEAWRLNNARLRGEAVSRWCREPKHLAYGTACLLGAQLQRLYAQVPRERVHVVLLDDVKLDARKAYLKVLSFLGVDDDGRTDFAVKNPAKARKSMLLRRAVQVLGGLKRSLGIKHRFGLLNAIDKRNIQYRARAPLSEEMRADLHDFFREDVALLERLLCRNLTHWRVRL